MLELEITENIILQRDDVILKSLQRVRSIEFGLAKRELNLSAIVGKSAEAHECRLVPEVIEGFFSMRLL